MNGRLRRVANCLICAAALLGGSLAAAAEEQQPAKKPAEEQRRAKKPVTLPTLAAQGFEIKASIASYLVLQRGQDVWFCYMLVTRSECDPAE